MENLAATSDSPEFRPGSYPHETSSTGLSEAHTPASSAFNNNSRHIYMFINPDSGSFAGVQFIKACIKRIELVDPLDCEIIISNIKEGSSGDKPGFHSLKRAIERSNLNEGNEGELNTLNGADRNIRFVALVAGGDGTVMWCIEELWKHGVDTSALAIAVIPCGTGNDFAGAFGWKAYSLGNPFDNSMKTLRRLVIDLFASSTVLHDIWRITVKLRSDGHFSKIDSETRQKNTIKVDDSEEKVLILTFFMSNYFSFGIESRIGRGFDRHRAQNKHLNKMRYFIEGLKKSMMRVERITTYLDRVCEVDESKQEHVVFTCEKSASSPAVLKNAVTLVALNIPSFSAGNDVWKSSKKLGVVYTDRQQAQQRKRTLLSQPQITGDSVLEFLSFPHVSAFGLEFIVKGQGRKVYQGSGPWVLHFKEIPAEKFVYFQVDGEYFRMSRPDVVEITHHNKVPVLLPSYEKLTCAQHR